MAEMNFTNQRPREVFEALTNKRLECNPRDAFALALKEALFHIPEEKLGEIATRLDSALKDSVRDLSMNASLAKETHRYIRMLGDKRSNTRRIAAYALGKIEPKTKGAVPALIAALKDESSYVRERAVEALGRMGPAAKEAVPALSEVLKGKDLVIRFEAAWALGKIKDPAAVPSLEVILEDRNWIVRQWAAYALGEIGDRRAIEPLRARLERRIFGRERVKDVRDTIKEALVKISG